MKLTILIQYRYLYVSTSWTKTNHWSAEKQKQETKRLIRVRKSLFPALSNQMMPLIAPMRIKVPKNENAVMRIFEILFSKRPPK